MACVPLCCESGVGSSISLSYLCRFLVQVVNFL